MLDLADFLKRRGVPCRLMGIEINPHAVRRARERAVFAHLPDIEFRCAKLETLPAGCTDVVLSSFVLHHLSKDELHLWMRQMRRVATEGAVQVDFRAPYIAPMRWVWQGMLACAGFSQALREDGRTSLVRAWTAESVQEACRAAGWEPESGMFGGLCVQVMGRWALPKLGS
ncbi:MAG: hypothetical protein AMXMBFR7_40870 [Planctomycetota bacterium]